MILVRTPNIANTSRAQSADDGAELEAIGGEGRECDEEDRDAVDLPGARGTARGRLRWEMGG